MTIGSWQIIILIEALSPFIFAALVLIWLGSRVANRAGFSGWWALLIVLPPINIVLVWVLAFKRWPALPQSDRLPPPEFRTP